MSVPLPTMKEIESGMDQDGLNSGVSPCSSIHSLSLDPATIPVESGVVESQIAGRAEEEVTTREEVALEQVRTYIMLTSQLLHMQ